MRAQRQEARHVGRLERAGETGLQAKLAATIDEAGERRDIHVIEQAAFAFLKRVEHRAAESAFGHQLQQIKVRRAVGEQHADELRAGGEVFERVDRGLPRGVRGEADLDVIDAGRRQSARGRRRPRRANRNDRRPPR